MFLASEWYNLGTALVRSSHISKSCTLEALPCNTEVPVVPNHCNMPGQQDSLLTPYAHGFTWEHLQQRCPKISLSLHYNIKSLMWTNIRLFFLLYYSCCKVGLGWEGALQHSHRGHRYIADLQNHTWKIQFLWVKHQEEWLMSRRWGKARRQTGFMQTHDNWGDGEVIRLNLL